MPGWLPCVVALRPLRRWALLAVACACVCFLPLLLRLPLGACGAASTNRVTEG
jgi:hypothetical protein